MDVGEKVIPFGRRLFSMPETTLQARDVLIALATAGVALILGLAVRMAYELGRMDAPMTHIINAPFPEREKDAAEADRS